MTTDLLLEEPKPGGSLTVSHGMTASEVTVTGDLAVAAAAAKAAKEIELAFAIAFKSPPRNIDVFRETMIRHCRRKTFAETALYCRPAGRERDPATGQWRDAFAINFSIRFMEAAIQAWQHVHTTASITFENSEKRLLNVKVFDLQNNVSYAADAMIEKLVERRELKDRVERGRRLNSSNETVYLVDATKDEVRSATGAERSKLIRDQAQRLFPRDVLEECRAYIDSTVKDENAKDPDSAKKKILDKFASLGIGASMLAEYMGGQPFESLTADGLSALGALFNGLKDGQWTWPEVMKSKREQAESAVAPAKEKTGGAKKLRDKLLQQPLAPAEEEGEKTNE
jgi:hypothetical protein